MAFDTPLHIASRAGKLWIGPSDAASSQVELSLKGISWSGSQRKGCVHELYKYTAQAYIDFLARNNFNIVRLPLSVPLVTANAVVPRGQGCGEYSGLRHLEIVDAIVNHLAAAGILVSLCMHTSSWPSRNEGLWCAEDECNERSEEPLRIAWTRLAQRCADAATSTAPPDGKEHCCVSSTPASHSERRARSAAQRRHRRRHARRRAPRAGWRAGWRGGALLCRRSTSRAVAETAREIRSSTAEQKEPPAESFCRVQRSAPAA